MYFTVECFQVPNLAAGHINLLGRRRLCVIVLASVCRQLALGLSCMNASVTEGSQIITFLVDQNLPPQLDPLFPTPFSWLSHTAPNIKWRESSHPQREQAMLV